MSIRRFLFRGRWDDERARELEAHLAIEIDENIARGLEPEAARRAALRKLGNRTLVREEIYQMNSMRLVDAFWQDLKYAVRGLRRSPAFAAVALLSLALGIGANSAIFELIDAVRLQTLPVPNPQDVVLVRLKSSNGTRGSFQTWYPALTNPIWERLRSGPHDGLNLFAWSPAGFDISSSGRSRVTDAGLWVSGSYFETLGVGAVAGRLLAPSDDVRGCAAAAVISYAFWRREFGGDPSVVGHTMPINRRAVEIVGVAEPRFTGVEVGRSFDVALPICAEPLVDDDVLDSGTTWWVTPMARLAPGTSMASAGAMLATVSPAIFEQVPANYPPESVGAYRSFSLVIEPAGRGLSFLREQYVESLWILLAIAAAVLLIASANLANLMLARASARQREIALRLAIGASRGRVLRQLVAESLLLAAIGASAGIAIAGVLGRALMGFLATDTSAIVLPLDVNWRVAAFTSAMAAVCAALFGLAPAVRSTRVVAQDALKAGGRSAGSDRRRSLLRRGLVVCQLAVSLALVVCAFQFVATFRSLATLDPGFRQDGVVETVVEFTRVGLPPERTAAFRRELLDRIRAVPGVKSAAGTQLIPISGASQTNAVWVDGQQRDPERGSNFNTVTDGYFGTLGIPILAGRDFDAGRDLATAPRVAIVNEAFASRFLPAGSPLGRRFWVERTPSTPQVQYEVVGLVKNTKYRELRASSPPIAYLCAWQVTRPSSATQAVVRSDLPASDITAGIERSLSALNPDIVVSFRILATRIRESLRREELMAALSGSFGALAALLAAIGLYGVLSYATASRRGEIGIRMALGASRADIVALVAREAGVLIVMGLMAGAALAVAGLQTARTLLFGVTPGDLPTLGLAAASFALLAAMATLVPALRASSLQPTAALREE